jgi:hypothetical protein
MQLSEMSIRINYFHEASDEHLRLLRVDRSLLPTRQAWRTFYQKDYARPIRERINYSLVWRRGGQVVGFRSTDRIDFGNQAFMHLHLSEAEQRNTGLVSWRGPRKSPARWEATAQPLRPLFPAS